MARRHRRSSGVQRRIRGLIRRSSSSSSGGSSLGRGRDHRLDRLLAARHARHAQAQRRGQLGGDRAVQRVVVDDEDGPSREDAGVELAAALLHRRAHGADRPGIARRRRRRRRRRGLEGGVAAAGTGLVAGTEVPPGELQRGQGVLLVRLLLVSIALWDGGSRRRRRRRRSQRGGSSAPPVLALLLLLPLRLRLPFRGSGVRRRRGDDRSHRGGRGARVLGRPGGPHPRRRGFPTASRGKIRRRRRHVPRPRPRPHEDAIL